MNQSVSCRDLKCPYGSSNFYKIVDGKDIAYQSEIGNVICTKKDIDLELLLGCDLSIHGVNVNDFISLKHEKLPNKGMGKLYLKGQYILAISVGCKLHMHGEWVKTMWS